MTRRSKQLRGKKMTRHFSTNYAECDGIKRLGYTDPVAFVDGTECLVLCRDRDGQRCVVSREEAMGWFWFPAGDEYDRRCAEARELFGDTKQWRNGAKPTAVVG